MILASSLIGNWEKFTVNTHTNFAVLMFLFMVCAFEVVLLKLTTSNSAAVFGRADTDYDDSSEYEEDIYYEDLHNNYEHWARRRMRYRQRQQRQEQEMLRQFRLQQQQQEQQELQRQQQQQQRLSIRETPTDYAY